MSADLDLFHVCMKDGSVRQMNADQIDEAFHAGLIDGKCGVVRAGELEWTTLGELAGLDDDGTPAPHSVAPVAMDASGDMPAFRPRRGRFVAGFLAAALLVSGIGFAATKARPGFVTSSFAKLKSLRTTAATTTTTEAPKAAAAVVAPPPAPPPPAKIEEPKPAPSASVNVPTFDPKSLPDAKGKAKSKRR